MTKKRKPTQVEIEIARILLEHELDYQRWKKAKEETDSVKAAKQGTESAQTNKTHTSSEGRGIVHENSVN